MLPEIAIIWQYVRGDLDPEAFARWSYESSTLEALLGEAAYLELIETNFRDVKSLWDNRLVLADLLRARPDHVCECPSLADTDIVDMGSHAAIFESLENVGNYGKSKWWLWAARCRQCGDAWLVGQEERVNDIFCMKRISSAQLDGILANAAWPSDFDQYETMLEIGYRAGRAFTFVDPQSSVSLRASVRALAQDSPGIALSKIAHLLNLDRETARLIAIDVATVEGITINLEE